VDSGRNAQPDDPLESPGRAGAEQRSANTPAGVPTEPAGTGSGVDRFMAQWVVAALMAVVRGAAAEDAGLSG
jgi:hypothetical protein